MRLPFTTKLAIFNMLCCMSEIDESEQMLECWILLEFRAVYSLLASRVLLFIPQTARTS